MSMSLDGYVADSNDGIDEVFAWMMNGEVTLPSSNPELSFQVSEASAELIREEMETVGAVVSGRRTFDLAGGWGGQHPMGVPAFVVTHEMPDGWPREGSSVHIVTDGLESAVEQAKEAAGDKVVGVGGADVAQQCLNAGLLDQVRVNLVPVLLGDGVPFFANLRDAPLRLQGPRVIEGDGVTHLHYEVVST
jgi:dihydrofolate reductase